VYDALYTHRCKKFMAAEVVPSLLSEPLILIGRGTGRLCYQHPIDSTLCIKIPRAARGANESRREYRYIKLINTLHKEDTSQHVTAFYGRICTSIGPGWLVERVMDEDGVTASPMMHECLTKSSFETERNLWVDAFNEFMTWCTHTAVVVRDASVNNICVKRLTTGALRFVLFDGVGPRGFLPRAVPLKFYAHRRNYLHAQNSEFTSIENLVEFCQKLRNDRQYHRDTVVDIPSAPVKVLKRVVC